MLSKLLTIASLLIIPNIIYSALWTQSPHDIINNHSCTKKIKQTIYGEWKTSREWLKDLSTNLNSISFKSPTDQLGKWTYVKATKNQFQARLHTPKQIIHATWNNNCEIQIQKRTGIISKIKKRGKYLSDKELEKLVQKDQRGIIYVWAPEMPYSVQGIKEIKNAAKKVNVPVRIYLSPNSDKKMAKEMLLKNKLDLNYLTKHHSYELHQRGIDLHYPSVITFNYKTLDRYARHGYEPEERFLSYLRKEFAK